MTDAELIARLRSNIFGTGTTMLAADRMEALIAEGEKDHANINLKADFIDKTINQLAEAEAKLAKAVEAMRETLDAIEGYNQTLPDEDGLYWDGANAGLIAQEIVSARTTLAEIKGAIHD